MTHQAFGLVRVAAFLLSLLLVLWLERRARHAAGAPSWRVNGGLWFVDGLVLGAVCGTCACTVALWAGRAGVGLLNLAATPPWIAVPASVLALDFVSYGWHRANHRIALLWRFHRVHHSDASFTATTGLRFHPGELLLSLPLRLAAIAAVGAPVVAVACFEAVFTFANLFEHGNVNLPSRLEERLARVSVTPALHRRHHCRRRPDLDSNFGTIFTFWDRLLGTYTASSSSLAVDVGLSESPAPPTLSAALRLPFGA